MEGKTKRVRSSNFSNDEKLLLLNLAKKYSHIIENKKTDGLWWKTKEKTWDKIAEEFNAQNPAALHRNKETLKMFYNNKKKETRKAAAAERREMIKTGGGVAATIIKDPTFELTMSILNQKTVIGFQGIPDGDEVTINDRDKEINNSVVENNQIEEEEELMALETEESAKFRANETENSNVHNERPPKKKSY